MKYFEIRLTELREIMIVSIDRDYLVLW